MLVTYVATSWAHSPRSAWHFLVFQLYSKFLQCLISTQAGRWVAARTYSNSRLPRESNTPSIPTVLCSVCEGLIVKACGPSEGFHQLKVTVLEVILHVIPEIHCGEERDLDVRSKSQSHPNPIPCWAMARPAPWMSQVSLPAIQPWDCWTWWNHRAGRYSSSPARTVQ